MTEESDAIKEDILEALAHPEAEDGLYLNNLQAVHEEEERKPVRGTQYQILEAMKDLIEEGKVSTDDSGEEVIFMLVAN